MQPNAFHTARQLGAVIRAARERAGLSQRELAERADLERQWIVLLETGKLDNPTLRNVFKATAALGLQLELTALDDVGSDQPGLDDLLGR